MKKISAQNSSAKKYTAQKNSPKKIVEKIVKIKIREKKSAKKIVHKIYTRKKNNAQKNP